MRSGCSEKDEGRGYAVAPGRGVVYPWGLGIASQLEFFSEFPLTPLQQGLYLQRWTIYCVVGFLGEIEK